MCGICGILNTDQEPVAPALLAYWTDMLSHRGPDASGLHTEPGLGLGHSRLGIIDLEGGAQPMSNEDGSIWITFNGEVFNYLELREELLGKGHQFHTRSDTEVLLHLYEEEAEGLVHRLNGQWAFALWDRKGRKLFLSRDRLGIRPLFYTQAGESFLFASAIKVLLSHPSVQRDIDLEALQQVFTFWCPLPPRTVFRDIRSLPPGHNLVVRDGHLQVKPYFSLRYDDTRPLSSEQDCVEELRGLLVDATRLRLRSDVPVGAYLSGGLDSSVTTAIIRRFTDTPLKTFSVAFEDGDYDESSYQEEVVRHLGTDHHAIQCSCDDIARVFPAVVGHTEAPILRTAPAPLFLLSSLVRENGYKVVLTGEGSDEMLGGYDIFKEAKIRRFWGQHASSRMRPLLLKRLYPYLQQLQSQSPAYLQAFFHVQEDDLSNPLFSHLPRWELTSRLQVFFSDAVKDALRACNPTEDLLEQLPVGFDSWHSFSKGQYLEAYYLLPGYILSSQGDRMAMAHSVEGRFPFLDPRVIEFASRLPPRLKMKALNEKYVLKRAAEDWIPAAVRRRPKQPYRAPDARSFFDGSRPRESYVEEVLSPSALERDGLFHPGAVERLLSKVKSGRFLGIKDNMALVGILSTQILIQQHIRALPRASENGRSTAKHGPGSRYTSVHH